MQGYGNLISSRTVVKNKEKKINMCICGKDWLLYNIYFIRKMVHKEFADIFHRFVKLPIIKGSFAEKIYHKFEFLPGHLLEKNHSTVVLRYKIEKDIINMNGSVHGGALATLLDCATTIAILRGDKNLSRTVRLKYVLKILALI